MHVTTSQYVSFWQPLQLHCLHHGSTNAYLCNPLCLIPFSSTAQMVIFGTQVMVSMQLMLTWCHLVTASRDTSRVFSDHLTCC